LVIFGPKNLPKLGSALGKAVKGVREGVDSVNTELEAAKKTVGGSTNESEGAEAPVTATAVVEEVPVLEAQGLPQWPITIRMGWDRALWWPVSGIARIRTPAF